MPRRRLALLPMLLCIALGSAPAAFAGTVGGLQYGTASQAPAPARRTGDDPAAAAPSPGGTTPDQLLPNVLPTPEAPLPAPATGQVATLLADGLAAAPAGAPAIVQAMIAAGNRIARAKYVWGGGHQRWEDKGYDCSGSVSYVLHAVGLTEDSMVSGELARWGDPGRGAWVTIYGNSGHVYMTIAGLRFDTSGQKRSGSRWQVVRRSNKGFKVRHPVAF